MKDHVSLQERLKDLRVEKGLMPDLKHPQTLNEKLLKQKLERFGTDPVVRQCADKYRVRDYVDVCGCGGTLNRLLAVYDRPEAPAGSGVRCPRTVARAPRPTPASPP